jgi:hypothetical protein
VCFLAIRGSSIAALSGGDCNGYSGRPALLRPSTHLALSSGRRSGIRVVTFEIRTAGLVCNIRVTILWASFVRPASAALAAAMHIYSKNPGRWRIAASADEYASVK